MASTPELYPPSPMASLEYTAADAIGDATGDRHGSHDGSHDDHAHLVC